MNKPTILALDLGIKTGWAFSYPKIMYPESLLGTYGCKDFSTKRIEGAGMRYLHFHEWLYDMKRKLTSIDQIYFEEIRGHKGTAAAHVYGGFLATLTGWCEKENIPYQGVVVQPIKKFIAGKGNANKKMVMDALKKKGYEVEDDNEADALALLLYVMEN